MGSHMFGDQDILNLKKQMTRRSDKNTEGSRGDEADGASHQERHREPPMFPPRPPLEILEEGGLRLPVMGIGSPCPGMTLAWQGGHQWWHELV